MSDTLPFNRKTVKPGDPLVMDGRPDVRMRFKAFGHDGCVIAELEADSLRGRGPRDVILRQRECRVPA